MKKLFLLLVLLAAGAYSVSAQTISVTGTSGTINAGDTFTTTLTLNITDANSIGDVESVNILLRTPTAGNGQTYFTLGTVTPISPFTNPNNGAASTFNTAGDMANSSFTVSDPFTDEGSNAPAASAPTVASIGTTNIAFENLDLISSAGTPAGTYLFSVTLGGLADPQGSYIFNSSDQSFDINSALNFSITIEPTAVPEPSTWLAGVGALGVIGYTMLRRRRATA